MVPSNLHKVCISVVLFSVKTLAVVMVHHLLVEDYFDYQSSLIISYWKNKWFHLIFPCLRKILMTTKDYIEKLTLFSIYQWPALILVLTWIQWWRMKMRMKELVDKASLIWSTVKVYLTRNEWQIQIQLLILFTFDFSLLKLLVFYLMFDQWMIFEIKTVLFIHDLGTLPWLCNDT